MRFFIFMFICNLLTPLIMITAGFLMYKKPPKEINGLIGYRTAMSQKNKDTWFFAQTYCGKLWLKIGAALSIPSVIVQIPFINAGEDVLGTLALVIEFIQIAVLISSVFSVEKALKRTFDENGNRKGETNYEQKTM